MTAVSIIGNNKEEHDDDDGVRYFVPWEIGKKGGRRRKLCFVTLMNSRRYKILNNLNFWALFHNILICYEEFEVHEGFIK